MRQNRKDEQCGDQAGQCFNHAKNWELAVYNPEYFVRSRPNNEILRRKKQQPGCKAAAARHAAKKCPLKAKKAHILRFLLQLQLEIAELGIGAKPAASRHISKGLIMKIEEVHQWKGSFA
ncbi:MAG TPA: hypothetical protein PLO51_01075 [Candidatus Micrarchaeota archaeon]|nr:hypothetical protein [Candidatus Micrarchaeota archaeon]